MQPWEHRHGVVTPVDAGVPQDLPHDTHLEPPPHNQPYRPALDGIRALAIIPVLIFHLKERWFPGGFVGVDIFFVISGYLITNGLLRDLRRGDFSLRRFYQRRIARLFPSMVLVLLISSLAALVLYDRAITGLLAPVLAASVVSLNNVLSAYESNYFSAAADIHPFLHFWSLSVEEQFYLFFPLLLLLLWRWRQRGMVAGLLLTGAVSLAACVWMTGRSQTWAFYMLPTRAWELIAGGLLAALPVDALRRGALWRTVAGWAGLLLVLLSFAVVRSAHFPGAIAVLPVLGTVLLVAGVSGARNAVDALFSSRALQHVGRLSYVLYLWHLPVFSLVDYRLFLAPEWKRTVLKLALTVALSVMTAFFVENPARWWLNRRENRRVAFGFALSAVCLFVAGGLAMRMYGWPEPQRRMVADGGLLLHRGSHGTMALLGDSQACATATMLRSIAAAHDLQLKTMCMSATVPLAGGPGDAWTRTLEGVQRTRPDILVYEMAWPAQQELPEMLAKSVAALSPYTHRLVLVLQYPVLRPGMPRQTLRDGIALPFYELPENKPWREWTNGVVRTFAAQHGIAVVETGGGFTQPDGSVRVLDEDGRPMYFDWMHASSRGTASYRAALERAVLAEH